MMMLVLRTEGDRLICCFVPFVQHEIARLLVLKSLLCVLYVGKILGVCGNESPVLLNLWLSLLVLQVFSYVC